MKKFYTSRPDQTGIMKMVIRSSICKLGEHITLLVLPFPTNILVK